MRADRRKGVEEEFEAGEADKEVVEGVKARVGHNLREERESMIGEISAIVCIGIM